MTEHAVVIAGGGPTGMMLAAELALAKVDVAIVERRPDHVLAGSRAGGLHLAHDRGARSARGRRSVPRRGSDARGHAVRHDHAGHERLPDASSVLRSGSARTQIERIMAAWIAELPVRDLLRKRGDGLRAGRHRRRRRAVGRPVAASAVSRRVRRRTQRDPQGGRHRVPGVGSDEEQPDRRGRDDRGAAELGIRHDAAGIHGLGRMEDGSDGPGRRDRAADRAEQRAHAARSERGAHHGVRHRLRGPQSHVDLQVHRHDPAGRGLPRGTRPPGRRRGARALPRRRTGPQPRRAGRGEPGLEARAGGQRDLPGEPPGHLPRRAPSGRRPRAAAHDGAGRAPAPRRAHEGRWSMSCRSSRAWTSLASGSPGSAPAWTSTTTSARDTRCSDAGCPISTS